MIDNGVITLDPDLVIRCGEHRCRQLHPHLWECTICRERINPGGKYVPCQGHPPTERNQP